jgi:nucleoside 2-deoxyribosyltransferase
MMKKKLLYLAGPLFNTAERHYNMSIRSILSPHFEVYLPHLDGPLFPSLVASGVKPAEAKRRIFAGDIAALERCDVFLIILNGRAVDEGAAVELGIAWALKKACFGLKDDFRQLTASGDNPMIEGAIEKIFYTVRELEDWATKFSIKTLSKNKAH